VNSDTAGPGGGEGSAASALAPVRPGERISHIDTLRGVAVLGILVMNIYAFAMPFVAYQNPLAYGGTEWFNLGTWFVTHILFDQKFMTIFSILFGAGLILMKDRAEARGKGYTGVWYRRNFWLLLIGMLHGYLLWFGDILFHYALVGMLVFLFRNRSPRTLVIVAGVLLPIGMMMAVAGGTYMHKLQAQGVEVQELVDAGEELTAEQQEILTEWEQASIFMKPPNEQVAEDLAAYQGGYAGIVQHRAPTVVMMQTQGTIGFVIWRVGALMLLGMALMKLGILSGSRSDEFYRRMMVVGYGLGIPIMLFSAWNLNAHQWDMLWMFQYGGLPNYVGSLFVACGHIGLVMTIVNEGLLAGLMARFAAVGRMAFTNYLMHSLVMTTLFYGYGAGLYGAVPRAWQMAFVAGMLGFQLWFSPWWLARFRFGPMEGLWRSLTYWRLQPMRIASTQ
jgi:uncharacterized protein